MGLNMWKEPGARVLMIGSRMLSRRVSSLCKRTIVVEAGKIVWG